MKMNISKVAIIAMAAVSFAACDSAENKIKNANETASNTSPSELVDNKGKAELSFEQDTYDFGDINEGDVVTREFNFTNTGDAPLIISNAQGSCGCTVPQWPKEPIAPGESSSITVEFNSQGREGQNRKDVTITANTIPNTKKISFTANVLKVEK